MRSLKSSAPLLAAWLALGASSALAQTVVRGGVVPVDAGLGSIGSSIGGGLQNGGGPSASITGLSLNPTLGLGPSVVPTRGAVAGTSAAGIGPGPTTGGTATGAESKKGGVLFLCTGNTCRSPMAENLLRARLEREGEGSVPVLSRGLAVASEGEGMAENAVDALKLKGIDAAPHGATSVTQADVEGATVILGMTASHVAELLRRFPKAAGKAFTVHDFAGTGAGDVADPYGQELDVYLRTADELDAAMASVAARLRRSRAP